jgi:hypothetical protein
LSVGEVVVDAGVVDVVVAPRGRVLDVVVDAAEVVVVALPVLPVPLLGAVVVVVAGAGGATKALVSALSVAVLLEGVTARLVQLRAAFQLWTAAVAGWPVRGWGRPATIVAGRNTALVTWRPSAVRMSAPLSVSGGVSS